MPQGNKKPRTSNKKKNKCGQSSKKALPGSSAAASDNANLQMKDFPTWNDLSSFVKSSNYDNNGEEEEEKGNPKDPPIKEVKTVARRYKEATERFKESLRRKVPASIFSGGAVGADNNTSSSEGGGNDSSSSSASSYTVTAFMDAVDYLANTDIVIEKEMMTDLKIAITARKRVAEYYSTTPGSVGSDEGHEHFITVLSYCWGKLRSKTASGTRTRQGQQKQNDDDSDECDDDDEARPLSNRFGSLALESQDDDDDEDDDDEIDNMVEIPTTRPSVPKMLTFDELLDGSDRIDAIMFLLSLDELMQLISFHYSKLKKAYREGKKSDGNKHPPTTTIIEQLMEAAVASNFTIQLVASLEQQLIADHPHLNTVYRLLAIAVRPDLVDDVIETVTKHRRRTTPNGPSPSSSSSSSEEFKKTYAIEFVGDALECVFRTVPSTENRREKLVKGFATRWCVPEAEVKEIERRVYTIGRIQVPFEEEMNTIMSHIFAQADVNPHSWFPMFKFIGCDRSITSTIRILQEMGLKIPSSSGQIRLKEGGYPERKWDGKRRLATRIQHNLDLFMFEDVLPVLISMCYDGMLSTNLPYQQELLPFFSEFKAFVKNPLQPVSWSLAFSVHSLLTSVIEVQGDDDVHNMGSEAKTCFDKCFDQIEWAFESRELVGGGHRPRPRHWEFNLTTLHKIAWLDCPRHPDLKRSPADRELQIYRAVWNPLCAGSLLLYSTYFTNLEGGTAMINSFGQLRMVLHLSNAFLRHGALNPGEVELLDWLQDTFQKSKTIWEGVIPDKGQFVYRWLITSGNTPEAARLGSEDTQRGLQGVAVAPAKTREQLAGGGKRNITKILPQNLAKSFRRICLRDFSDVEDRYYTAEERRRQKHSEIYRNTVRMYDTMNALNEEQRLLATNLISLGEILDQFIASLFRELGLESNVKKLLAMRLEESNKNSRRPPSQEVSDTLERSAMFDIMSHLILGPLDFDPEPLSMAIVAKTAVFMKTYFSQVDPKNYMIFTPVK